MERGGRLPGMATRVGDVEKSHLGTVRGIANETVRVHTAGTKALGAGRPCLWAHAGVRSARPQPGEKLAPHVAVVFLRGAAHVPLYAASCAALVVHDRRLGLLHSRNGYVKLSASFATPLPSLRRAYGYLRGEAASPRHVSAWQIDWALPLIAHVKIGEATPPVAESRPQEVYRHEPVCHTYPFSSSSSCSSMHWISILRRCSCATIWASGCVCRGGASFSRPAGSGSRGRKWDKLRCT